MNQKGFINIVLSVVAFIVVILLAFWLLSEKGIKPKTTPTPEASESASATPAPTITVSPTVLPTPTNPAGWKTLNIKDLALDIKYPTWMTLYTGTNISKAAVKTYIPVCPPNSLACLLYNNTEFNGTNYQGAGIAVGQVASISEGDCMALPNQENPNARVTTNIGGADFNVGTVNKSQSNNLINGQIFRTYRNNTCIEISAMVAKGDFSSIADGSTKEFTKENETRLMDYLVKVISTFKFK